MVARAPTWVVHHGDCLDVMRAMPDKSVDIVVTSPPYNQLGSRIPSKGTGCMSNSGFIDKVNRCGYSDDMEEPDYVAWLGDVAAGLARVVRPGGSFFFNHKIRYRDKAPIHPWDIVTKWPGWSVRQEIVWDRGGSIVFNARMYAPCDERIYWLVRDGADHEWNQPAASLLSVWTIPANATGIEHPCPFPVDLARHCLVAVAKPGAVVYDPFTGSGQTGIAALDEGCAFIGSEKHAPFVAIARARIEAAARAPMLDFGGIA